jgi:hypothetical protein
MVKNPELLSATSLSLICTVSGCKPSNSDHGCVLKPPWQYFAKIAFTSSEEFRGTAHSFCNFLLRVFFLKNYKPNTKV